MLKLDIDSRDFSSYKDRFKTAYRLLRYKQVHFDKATVFRTKKGYHIYIADVNFGIRDKKKLEMLLVECLLGSDPMKQLFAYVEGADILFKNKKEGESVEKYAKRESHILNRIIRDVNREQVVQLVVRL